MGERVYIGDLALELGRVPHTIRVWCYNRRLPEDLMPQRDENGWRWWTREQVEGIKKWIEETDFRPGSYLRAKSRAARLAATSSSSTTSTESVDQSSIADLEATS